MSQECHLCPQKLRVGGPKKNGNAVLPFPQEAKQSVASRVAPNLHGTTLRRSNMADTVQATERLGWCLKAATAREVIIKWNALAKPTITSPIQRCYTASC
eukprot:CAMPEP_0206404696 /NCGR_PEP_ID=MMETSP0294-20121207/28573_1 /ASSEMBLY_ACC=CAM_ASM_000327 /TAXON_ID=39354 /ORGANISM="Heterosigma akashiwo, Strain CCMP2393" /LENGTH=99 /DNA_ID=CAMNT_0053862745 /DNA_START=135 /DNA_END=431 /DNA_ORIENTATION=+